MSVTLRKGGVVVVTLDTDEIVPGSDKQARLALARTLLEAAYLLLAPMMRELGVQEFQVQLCRLHED